ncbi:MAG: phosphate ABC transporter substrate-binding protein [Candidatus Bipolaricaulota bacterium]
MVGKRVLAVAVLGLLGLGMVAFATDVTISGSTTVLPIAQAVAEALAGSIEVEVSGGGSSVGIANLIDGTTMIADHSRGMKLSEVQKAVEKGVHPFTWHVANDAIAPVVHPSNPVSDLTLEQLKKIYTGEFTNWNQVGGSNQPIVIVSRDSSSGTFETWGEKVMHGADVSSGAIYTTSNADVASEVSSNPNAIGYVGVAYVTPQLKALTVSGAVASIETAVDLSFPISRPLYMSTNGFPSGDVLKVILYVLSDAGQRLVQDVGYAPIRVLP